MTKRILVAVFVTTSLVVSSPALAGHRHHHSIRGAAKGGDSNKGDVWVDNAGQPSGPGHEQDPHLACTDINLWGDKLADPSGTYTIDGWPPSGSKKIAWGPTSWSYNQALGGSQIISVINVTQLINNAVANGDTAQPQQGFHFKLQFSQDPQKHKTFWVRCAAPTTKGGPPPPPGGPPPGNTTPPPGTPTTPTTTTSPSTGVNVQAPSTAPKAKPKKKKAKVLAKRLRHRRGFTG